MQRIIFFIIDTIERGLYEFANLEVFTSRDDSGQGFLKFSKEVHPCGTREWRGLGWNVMVSPPPVRPPV